VRRTIFERRQAPQYRAASFDKQADSQPGLAALVRITGIEICWPPNVCRSRMPLPSPENTKQQSPGFSTPKTWHFSLPKNSNRLMYAGDKGARFSGCAIMYLFPATTLRLMIIAGKNPLPTGVNFTSVPEHIAASLPPGIEKKHTHRNAWRFRQ